MDYEAIINKFLENKEQKETWALIEQHTNDSDFQDVITKLLNFDIMDIINEKPCKDAHGDRIRRLIHLAQIFKLKVFNIYLPMLEKRKTFPCEPAIQVEEFALALAQSISSIDEIDTLEKVYLDSFASFNSSHKCCESNKANESEDYDNESEFWVRNVVFSAIVIYLYPTFDCENVIEQEFSDIANEKEKRKLAFYAKVMNIMNEKVSAQDKQDEQDTRTREIILYHNNFVYIFNEALSKNYSCLKQSIESFIIRVLTFSGIGYNCSIFREYFDMLKRINPRTYCKAEDVAIFIRSLSRNLANEDIFAATSIEKVGRILFHRVQEVIDIDDEAVIKIGIQKLREWPLNQRANPVTNEDYYREIAAYLDINRLPKNKYEIAKSKYSEVREQYETLISKIRALESECDKQIKESENRSNQIRRKTRSITDDQRRDSRELLIEIQKCKELESLFKSGSEQEQEADSFLKYSKENLAALFKFFIDESDEQKLRNWVLADVREKVTEGNEGDEEGEQEIETRYSRIEERFEPYLRIIKQFERIIGVVNDTYTPNPLETLRLLKYRNKWFPFEKKIKDKHWKEVGLKITNKSTPEYQRFNAELQNHALYVETLLGINSVADYLNHLRQGVLEALDMIRSNMNESQCLKRRKPILEKTIEQFNSKNYDVVLNLLPLQVEGLFADYLENSLLYRAWRDISVYEKIYNNQALLVRKANMADEKDLNLGFDIIGYFKYYFNSIYRNTVAHGNYFLLLNGIEDKDVPEEQAMEIIAHEMILDLNTLVEAIVQSNELDEAKNYLTHTVQALKSTDNDDNSENDNNSDEADDGENNGDNEDNDLGYDYRYERLMLDLLSRERYNARNYHHGVFITYDPIQILYWIFNPMFEDKIGSEFVIPIRDTLLSKDFWQYVLNHIDYNLTSKNKDSFESVVHRIINMVKGSNSETFDVLKKVNKKISEKSKL